LAWVAHTLRGRLAKLSGSPAGQLGALSLKVPDPDLWEPSTIPALLALLEQLVQTASTVSDDISTTYFTHSGDTKQSVGT
jgi:hypothetical protein